MNKKADIEIDFSSSGYLGYDENNFYIYGDIDKTLFEKIIIPLRKEVIKQLKTTEPKVNIYINSNGGGMDVGKELISVMEWAIDEGVEINTYVMSWAASMATMISIVATNRYVGKDARMLIHYPIGGDWKESMKQNENGAKEYAYLAKRAISHYNKYCNIQDIEEKLDEGNHTIFGGKELKKQGLADFII